MLPQPSESNSLIESIPFLPEPSSRHPQDLQDINVDMLTYQMRSVLPSISHSIQFFKQEDLPTTSSNNLFHDFLENTTLPSINSFMNNKKHFL